MDLRTKNTKHLAELTYHVNYGVHDTGNNT